MANKHELNQDPALKGLFMQKLPLTAIELAYLEQSSVNYSLSQQLKQGEYTSDCVEVLRPEGRGIY